MLRLLISWMVLTTASQAMASELYGHPSQAATAPQAVPVYTSSAVYPSPYVAPLPSNAQPAQPAQESNGEPHLQRLNF